MNVIQSFHLARLDQDMRAVLFQMALVSEGQTTCFEPHTGASRPASRPPLALAKVGGVHSLSEAWSVRYERATGVRQKARVVHEAKQALAEWRKRREHADEIDVLRDRRIVKEGEGMSPMEAAARFRCTASHIMALRRHPDFRRDPLTGHRWPEDEGEQAQRARHLWELGFTQKWIAEGIGVDQATVSRMLNGKRAA